MSGGTGGLYTLDGTTATAITTELDAAVFTPASAPNTITPTTFTLSDTSSAFGTPATDDATVVTNTVAAVAPTISGTHTSSTADNTPIDPFTSVVVADTNAAATDTLTVTLSAANGSLSGLGTEVGNVYTLTGLSAATITAELDAAVFTPTTGAPGSVTPTTFTLNDVSSALPGTPAIDAATVVTNTVPAVAPTISGTHAGQRTTNGAAIDPFSGVTITDATDATDTLTVTLSAANGSLSGLGADVGGVYTLTGLSAATITAELDAAVFTPAFGRAGQRHPNHLYAARCQQRHWDAVSDRRHHHGEQYGPDRQHPFPEHRWASLDLANGRHEPHRWRRRWRQSGAKLGGDRNGQLRRP